MTYPMVILAFENRGGCYFLLLEILMVQRNFFSVHFKFM